METVNRLNLNIMDKPIQVDFIVEYDRVVYAVELKNLVHAALAFLRQAFPACEECAWLLTKPLVGVLFTPFRGNARSLKGTNPIDDCGAMRL